MSEPRAPAQGHAGATARLLFKLSWRSLWRNRRRTQITLSSIGMGLSLAVFLGALSQGLYEKAVRDATELLSGQLTVETERYNGLAGLRVLAFDHQSQDLFERRVRDVRGARIREDKAAFARVEELVAGVSN